MTIRYFAYGANMSAALMRRHGVHFAIRVPARLPGFRLEFNVAVPRHPGLGYANVVPDPAGVVEGALYELDDAALTVLDDYEDYPTCYVRQPVVVVLADGRSVPAVTYVANPAWVRAGLRPSRTYLRHLLAGRDLLSAAYYERLCQTPTEKSTATRCGGSTRGDASDTIRVIPIPQEEVSCVCSRMLSSPLPSR